MRKVVLTAAVVIISLALTSSLLYAWEGPSGTAGRFGIGPGVEFQVDVEEYNPGTGMHALWWFTPRFGMGGSYASYNWKEYCLGHHYPYWYTYSQKSYWAYLYYRAAIGSRWSTYLGFGAGVDNVREGKEYEYGYHLPGSKSGSYDQSWGYNGTGLEVNMTIEYFLSPSVALWGRWGYKHITYFPFYEHDGEPCDYYDEQGDLDYTPVSFGLTWYVGGEKETEKE